MHGGQSSLRVMISFNVFSSYYKMILLHIGYSVWHQFQYTGRVFKNTCQKLNIDWLLSFQLSVFNTNQSFFCNSLAESAISFTVGKKLPLVTHIQLNEWKSRRDMNLVLCIKYKKYNIDCQLWNVLSFLYKPLKRNNL